MELDHHHPVPNPTAMPARVSGAIPGSRPAPPCCTGALAEPPWLSLPGGSPGESWVCSLPHLRTEGVPALAQYHLNRRKQIQTGVVHLAAAQWLHQHTTATCSVPSVSGFSTLFYHSVQVVVSDVNCCFSSHYYMETQLSISPLWQKHQSYQGTIFSGPALEKRVFALLPLFLGGTETASKLLTEKTRLREPFGSCNQPVLLSS